jgi:hypothetical protein
MTFVPIIIDGPARGKKMAVDGLTFVMLKQPKMNFSPYLNHDIADLTTDVTFDQVVYHVHKYLVGGMMFAIASVKTTPPPAEKMLKKIFTSAAIGAMMHDRDDA